jgi:hypothetical protein
MGRTVYTKCDKFENFRNIKAKLFSSVPLFYPENEESTFLRNVGEHLLDCTARHMPEDSIIHAVASCLKSFLEPFFTEHARRKPNSKW